MNKEERKIYNKRRYEQSKLEKAGARLEEKEIEEAAHMHDWRFAIKHLSHEDIECFRFYSGRLESFFNIVQGLPILISTRLKHRMETEFCTYDGVTVSILQFFQALERMKHTELEIDGIIYSELPRLSGSAMSKTTASGNGWGEYREAAVSWWARTVIMFREQADVKKRNRLLEAVKREACRNHSQFCSMLLSDYNISYETYMQYLTSAFATDGYHAHLYTTEQIITCAMNRFFIPALPMTVTPPPVEKKKDRKDHDMTYRLKQKREKALLDPRDRFIFEDDLFARLPVCAIYVSSLYRLDSDMKLSWVDKEIRRLLLGSPIQNFDIIPSGLPIHVSYELQINLDDADFMGLPELHYKQACLRIVYGKMAESGLKYSSMAKFTDHGDDWDAFYESYKELMLQAQEHQSHVQDNGSLLDFTAVLKNHQDFLKMLYHKYGLSHDEYMRCVLFAYASHGLFYPFNTHDEVIRCALRL